MTENSQLKSQIDNLNQTVLHLCLIHFIDFYVRRKKPNPT
jgi:hypothetical protein